MHFLRNFYFKTLKQDLLNKFFYKSIKDLPELEKIILNFGCKTNDLKRLSSSLLALEFIAGQKGKLNAAKKTNLVLKLRKGNPVGCSIILRKKKMARFLTKMLIEVFPNTQNFNLLLISRKIQTNTFTYDIKEILNFSELEYNYHIFSNLPNLKITFIMKSKTREELVFILNSYKLPIRMKSKYNSIGRV
jgi:large subunit ribosomal protein L5